MPARFIARSLVLGPVALGALALGSLTGCIRSSSGPRKTNPNAFTWSGPLAAPGVVQVRNTNGSITVEPSPDHSVHVLAATSWTRGDPTRDVKFEVVPTGGTLTICAIWNNGGCSPTDYSSGKRKRGIQFGWSSTSDARVAFTVQVPAGVKVDATTIEGEVNVRASAPVKARSIDGNVRVGTSVGPVDAETMNGDVDIRMTTLGEAGDVRAVTKNGTAVAWVPDITDGRVNASTLNGELGTDFGGPTGETMGRMREFKAALGTGARSYEIQTLNGSAWLRLINANGTVGSAAVASAAPIAPSKAVKRAPANKRNQ